MYKIYHFYIYGHPDSLYTRERIRYCIYIIGGSEIDITLERVGKGEREAP